MDFCIFVKKKKNVIIPWSEFQCTSQQKVLIACSGGVDSMVLLHHAASFFSQLGVVVVHHGWRENADRDVELIRSVCDRLKVLVHVEFIPPTHWDNVQGSWELEARNLRYGIFERLMQEFRYEKVLLGHHRDDVVETVLMNQLRGTGLSGMKGIPGIRGPYVRPLISFPKSALLQFAKANAISWMDDETNDDVQFFRNKIRHRLMPVLEDVAPHASETMARNAWFMGLQNELMNELVDEKLPLKQVSFGFIIDLSGLQTIKNASMLLFMVLRRYGFSLEQCTDVLAHIGQKNIRWHAKNWQVVVVDQILQLGDFPSKEVEFEGTVKEWNEQFFPKISATLERGESVVVRNWKPGDRLEYTVGKHKKVSDFLPTKGIYGLEKDAVLVVQWSGMLVEILDIWTHPNWR